VPAAPDRRADVARALLDRWFPLEPVIDDQIGGLLGRDTGRLQELHADPRYLIGRLSQALSALLADPVPPMDATALLLAEAIDDAVAYRKDLGDCPQCGEGVCSRCQPQWDRAMAYETLYGRLGLIDERPDTSPAPRRPILWAVPR
jgi:hypothetical protein